MYQGQQCVNLTQLDQNDRLKLKGGGSIGANTVICMSLWESPGGPLVNVKLHFCLISKQNMLHVHTSTKLKSILNGLVEISL